MKNIQKIIQRVIFEEIEKIKEEYFGDKNPRMANLSISDMGGKEIIIQKKANMFLLVPKGTNKIYEMSPKTMEKLKVWLEQNSGSPRHQTFEERKK